MIVQMASSGTVYVYQSIMAYIDAYAKNMHSTWFLTEFDSASVQSELPAVSLEINGRKTAPHHLFSGGAGGMMPGFRRAFRARAGA
jgi:hypothetical protein